MMQKVVIRINVKSPGKLMKIAACCIKGVEAVSITGDKRDLMEIIGVGLEGTAIIRLLRKKGWFAELVSTGPAKIEVQASSSSSTSTSGINEGSMVVMQLSEPIAYPAPPSYPVYETIDHDPHCNVMLIAVCVFPVISLLISLAKEMLTF